MKYALFIITTLLTFFTSYSQQVLISKMEKITPSQGSDYVFIRKAIEAGKAEIKMGAAAKSNSTNPEIIDFGKMIEEDHLVLNEKLRNIARQRDVEFSEQLSGESNFVYDKLKNLNGVGFDREFVTVMIKDHERIFDLFTHQAHDGKDMELKSFAKEALPNIENHLKQIKKIKLQIIQE